MYNDLGGYAGKILYIDLNNKNVWKKPIKLDLAKDFIGGAGLNAQLAYESIKPLASPLSPENSLIFGVGPFVGTLIPGAGKSCCSAKLPASGYIGISVTGSLGKLKFAGYDHLIILGKAENPVYIKILDDKIEFLDAHHIWGKDVYETTDDLWNEIGSEYTIVSIGPAGENLVTDASIIVDKYSGFSRGGLGAVMGSKNVKAIAIHGSKDICVANPDHFSELLEELNEKFFGQRLLDEWRSYGTLISLKPMAQTGLYPYKNHQEVVEPEKMLNIFDLNEFLEIKSGNVACMSCPVGCKHLIRFKGGKYPGLSLSVGCANAALQTWSCYCGSLNGWEDAFKCADMTNRLGLDWYNTSSLIAWTIELYQKGIIDKSVTDGLEPNWGEAGVIQELINKIALRQGFGDILAQGFKHACNLIGGNSEDYAVHIKGLTTPFDLRSRISSESFSQIVNVRGGHSSAVTVTMMPRRPGQMKKFSEKTGLPPEHAQDRVLNGPEDFHPGRITKWFEDNIAVLDSLGICQFPPFQQINLSLYADIYFALTGIKQDTQGLLKAGERICNMRKAFNLREGATTQEDVPPKRFLNEALKWGKETKVPLNEQYIKELVDDYYYERGWNQDGKISEAKIRETGLDKYLDGDM